MLQNNFWKLFILITVMILSTTARAMLFQSPTAAAEDFRKYALQRNQQTYTQWIRDNSVKTAVEAHPQVLTFSQQALKEGASKQVLNDWDRLRRDIEINKADREILTLLAEKLQQYKELCRYVLLDSELINILEMPGLLQRCLQKASSVPMSLPKQLGSQDLLVVDGIVLTKNQLPKKMMMGVYQWRTISDRNEDHRFAGTVEEFSKQKNNSPSWVSGDCKDYKLNHKDFAVLLQSQVYFSDTCVNPGIPPERTFSSWASEHKTLLWSVGLLAAGLAASQLKDKTLIITKP